MKKIPAPKKITRKKAKALAIKYFNRYIVLRDGKQCVQCGSTEYPTCGHLISVTAGDWFRFAEINAHCQCKKHNFRHEYAPEDYTTWFLREYSRGAYEILVDQKRMIVKYTTADFLAIAEKYKAACEGLAL